MDTLEKIFGNAAKVRMMRLFLFNPGSAYDSKDIASKTETKTAVVKREIGTFKKMGLIKSKIFVKNIGSKSKKGKARKVHSKGWILNDKFSYLSPLQHFLINVSPIRHEDLIKRLSRVGKIKLLIVSGVFIQEWESRVDLLVVGDHIKKHLLERVMKTIESEIGKEISYSSFETSDFQYRLGMYDKLIRDILDYPHEKVIDKLGIS
jgi:hypothetical protein